MGANQSQNGVPRSDSFENVADPPTEHRNEQHSSAEEESKPVIEKQKRTAHDLQMASMRAELEASKEATKKIKESRLNKPQSDNAKKLRELSDKLNSEKKEKEKEARKIADLAVRKHISETQKKALEVENNLKQLEAAREAARNSTRQLTIENILENNEFDSQNASTMAKKAIFDKLDVRVSMLSSNFEPIHTAVMLAVEVNRLAIASNKKNIAIAAISRMKDDLEAIIENGVEIAKMGSIDGNDQIRMTRLINIQKVVDDCFRLINSMLALWEEKEMNADWLNDLAESVESVERKRQEIEAIWRTVPVPDYH